jgi:hypothetical protein
VQATLSAPYARVAVLDDVLHHPYAPLVRGAFACVLEDLGDAAFLWPQVWVSWQMPTPEPRPESSSLAFSAGSALSKMFWQMIEPVSCVAVSAQRPRMAWLMTSKTVERNSGCVQSIWRGIAVS